MFSGKVGQSSRAFVERCRTSGRKPYFEYATVDEARQASAKTARENAGNCDYDGQTTDIRIPSVNHAAGIRAYVYTPAESKANLVTVFFHGGGMVVGSAESYHVFCQRIAQCSGSIFLSVDYRLCPDHPFPAMLEDAEEAVEWALRNAAALGATSGDVRFGVAGDSAGGTIAASVAHTFRRLDFQILIYPRVQPGVDLPSYEEFRDGPLLTLELIEWFSGQMSVPAGGNERLYALCRSDFAGLPKALFVLAECDPIRDDGIEYDKKLKAAGVHTELHIVKGVVHGFVNLAGSFAAECSLADREVCKFLQSCTAACSK